MNDLTIVGGRELAELLGTLPAKIEKNIMRTALRAGAVSLKEAVKQNVPVDSGALRSSVRVTTKYRKGRVTASVKAGNSIAWYAALVEYGTRPHLIAVDDADRNINRRSRKLESLTTVNRRQSLLINGTLVGPSVQHPGAQPRPFMRPALDAGLAAALAAVTAKVRQRLTKEGINAPEPVPINEAEQ